jgi:guanylate kinase
VDLLLKSPFVICTDGFTKTGKSTINETLAFKLSQRGLKVKVLSSGQLYRAIAALVSWRHGTDPLIISALQSDEIVALAKSCSLSLIDGIPKISSAGQCQELTHDLLNSAEISRLTPLIAAENQSVRRYVEAIIRQEVEEFNGVVLLDGRDGAAVIRRFRAEGIDVAQQVNFFVSMTDEAIRERFSSRADDIIRRNLHDSINTQPIADATRIDNSGPLVNTIMKIDAVIHRAMNELGIHQAPIIISGASGVGKNSVIVELLTLMPWLYLVPSYTTRPNNRPGSNKYIFVSEPEFHQLAASGRMIESGRSGSYWYGSVKLARPERLLFEIEARGASRVADYYDRSIRIKLTPLEGSANEQIEELRRRLLADSGNPRNNIDERLQTARIELAAEADIIIANTRYSDEFDTKNGPRAAAIAIAMLV